MEGILLTLVMVLGYLSIMALIVIILLENKDEKAERKGVRCQKNAGGAETKRGGERMAKQEQGDTQKAFEKGYIRGYMDGMLLARKETARKILETLYNCPGKYHEMKIKELAEQYGVDVEE